jgi:hypothetical protein
MGCVYERLLAARRTPQREKETRQSGSPPDQVVAFFRSYAGGQADGYFFPFSDAWAAASRAIGTRNGEQLT